MITSCRGIEYAAPTPSPAPLLPPPSFSPLPTSMLSRLRSGFDHGIVMMVYSTYSLLPILPVIHSVFPLLSPPTPFSLYFTLSGGSLIISDDLATIPAERVRLAQQLLPATNIAALPIDLMDKECPEILRLQLGRGRVSEGRG